MTRQQHACAHQGWSPASFARFLQTHAKICHYSFSPCHKSSASCMHKHTASIGRTKWCPVHTVHAQPEHATSFAAVSSLWLSDETAVQCVCRCQLQSSLHFALQEHMCVQRCTALQMENAAGMLKMVGGFLKSANMVTVGLSMLGKSFEMCCPMVGFNLVQRHCVAQGPSVATE